MKGDDLGILGIFNRNSNNNTPYTPSEPVFAKAAKANKALTDNVINPSTNQQLNSYRLSDLVFSCVSYAADICGQIVIKPNSSKKINKKVLNWFEQPNPFQSMPEVLVLYIQSYLLSGNAYLTFEKVGTSYEGWVLNPAETKIVPHTKKYIEGFLFKDKIAYKTDEVLFFKNPSVSTIYYGVSYLASLVDPLTIESYAVDDLKSFYEHSLIAQGIFTSEFGVTSSQVKALREQFNALYGKGGGERYGHIIAPNGLKYQPIRTYPKDGLLLESLGLSEDRIYKVFRMNPLLLGTSKQATNGTEVEAFKRLYINNFIRPIIYRLAKQWEVFFRRVLRDESFTISVDYDNIPEMNTALQEKITAVKEAVSIGLLSINEGRDAVGYDELDGKYTDTHLAPSFLTGTNPLDLVTGDRLDLGQNKTGVSNEN